MASDTGFTTLPTPVRTDTGKKVEVVEYFMYSCPHCYALDPLMHDWVKKQGDKIAFRRIHLAFSGPKDPQAHAYATLEAMGQLDQFHDKIFRAIHVERNRLNRDDAILDLLVKNGIDKAKYLDMFNSFGVQTKRKRNEQLIAASKIDEGAPTIVIDGRFVTSPAQLSRPGQSEPQTQAATLRVMDELVARVLKERAPRQRSNTGDRHETAALDPVRVGRRPSWRGWRLPSSTWKTSAMRWPARLAWTPRSRTGRCEMHGVRADARTLVAASDVRHDAFQELNALAPRTRRARVFSSAYDAATTIQEGR